MARKRTLSKNKRVKAVARQRIGPPKPTRELVEGAQRPKPKHKRKWQQEVES